MSDDEIRAAVKQMCRKILEGGRLDVEETRLVFDGFRLLHEINRDEREYEASPAAIERRALGESESEGRTAT